jgi:hypothetical protein
MLTLNHLVFLYLTTPLLYKELKLLHKDHLPLFIKIYLMEPLNTTIMKIKEINKNKKLFKILLLKLKLNQKLNLNKSLFNNQLLLLLQLSLYQVFMFPI